MFRHLPRSSYLVSRASPCLSLELPGKSCMTCARGLWIQHPHVWPCYLGRGGRENLALCENWLRKEKYFGEREQSSSLFPVLPCFSLAYSWLFLFSFFCRCGEDSQQQSSFQVIRQALEGVAMRRRRRDTPDVPVNKDPAGARHRQASTVPRSTTCR